MAQYYVGLTAEPDVLLPEELVQAAEFYNEDLPHSVMLSTEYRFRVGLRLLCSKNFPIILLSAAQNFYRLCSSISPIILS